MFFQLTPESMNYTHWALGKVFCVKESGERMSEKKVPKILLSQIEDALEEREGSDRRKLKNGLPANVPQDRRKGDRRSGRSHPDLKQKQ